MLSEPINFSFIVATIVVVCVVTAIGIVFVNKFKDNR